ncbi:ATP-binding protein [Fervidobacterium pennivorans subsp. shakshaketiis]|uniref:ATP-binding protein n=1 Tax=Fervidobacterium pennivorans TaxID=93466 RepID=UPI00355B57E5
MTREEILEILLRWNIWGRAKRIDTVPREALGKLRSLKDYHGVIVIKGPRRAGKSTLLYQLMWELSAERDIKSILYVNFEDYAFYSEKLTPKTLENILGVYRQEICPEGDFIIFLDEIQNVEDWHRWVRTVIDSGLAKTVFVTGSSSKLLSGELATLLSGRHVDIELLPFSFKEYLYANGYNPSGKLELIAKKDIYLSFLKDYLTFGGFPEIATRGSDEQLIYNILSDYAEDIIFKDIVSRYNTQNIKLLKTLSKVVAQNISNKISIRKLQKDFQDIFAEKSSTSTLSNYIAYLESAYYCFAVQRFDYSIKEINKTPAKYYLVDTGLRNAISPSFTPDRGRLLENAVYLRLRTMYEEIYYWEGKNEIDFVCRNKNTLDLYNVSYISDESELNERKLKGLLEFPHKANGRYVITWDLHKELSLNGQKIQFIPAYIFLSGDE